FGVYRSVNNTHCKCLDGSWAQLGCYCTHQTRIQPSTAQETYRSIGIHSLLHSFDQEPVDIFKYRFLLIIIIGLYPGNVSVLNKVLAIITVTGREGCNSLTYTMKAFYLAGKVYIAFCIIAIKERPDTDGITCSIKAPLCFIVYNTCKFCIKALSHTNYSPVYKQGKQGFTITM